MSRPSSTQPFPQKIGTNFPIRDLTSSTSSNSPPPSPFITTDSPTYSPFIPQRTLSSNSNTAVNNQVNILDGVKSHHVKRGSYGISGSNSEGGGIPSIPSTHGPGGGSGSGGRGTPNPVKQGQIGIGLGGRGEAGHERRRSSMGGVVVADEQKKLEKIDNIIQRFYSKMVQVICQSRITHIEDSSGSVHVNHTSASRLKSQPLSSPSTLPATRKTTSTGNAVKTDKWFNLEMEDLGLFTEELKAWKHVSSLIGLSSTSPQPSNIPGGSTSSSINRDPRSEVPPLIVDVILEVSEMHANQILVLTDRIGRKFRVEEGEESDKGKGIGGGRGGGIGMAFATKGNGQETGKKTTKIVLERWKLSFSKFSPSTEPQLPTVYKKCIILFRSLYTLVQTLPTWALHKKLARNQRGKGSFMRISCRLGTEESKGEIALDRPILEEEWTDSTTEKWEFGEIVTPFGSLCLESTYRLNVDFAVEDKEAVLSSHFIDEDFFKPTAARFRGSNPPPVSSLPAKQSRGKPLTVDTTDPSYGSLSSRHHVGATSPEHGRKSLDIPTQGSQKGATPSPPGETPTSGKFGSYGKEVEPAFVSDRIRTTSMGATSSGGRDSNVGSLPMGARRPSLNQGVLGTSPSGAHSPLFRQGSMINPSPVSNRQQPSSSLSSTSVPRSPSSHNPLFPQPGQRASPIPSIPIRDQTQSPSPRPIAAPSNRRYSSSGYSRSYGRGSSLGSDLPFGYGQSSESPGVESSGRRSRSSFESSSLGGAGGLTAGGLTEDSSTSTSAVTRLPTPAADADDINSFLNFLDTKPQLKSSTFLVRHGDGDKNLRIISKNQADQTLKRIAGSIHDSFTQGFAIPANSRKSKLSMEGNATSAVLEEDELEEEDPSQPSREPSSSPTPQNRHLYRRSIPSDRDSESSSPNTGTFPISRPSSRSSPLGNVNPIPFPSGYSARLMAAQSGSGSMIGSQNSGMSGNGSNTDLTTGIGMQSNRSFEDEMMVGQLELGGSGTGSATGWRERGEEGTRSGSGSGMRGTTKGFNARRWNDGK